MYGAFIALGAIMSIAGAIMSLVGAFPERGDVAWGLVYTGIGFFIFGFPFFWVNVIAVIKNQFIHLSNDVLEKVANVGVLEKQYSDLEEKLEKLVEKYFSHEAGLLEAFKNRTQENLSALLENFPQLEAMSGTNTLIEKLVTLRATISKAESDHNQVACTYNQYAQKGPYNYFIPKDLKTKFDFIDRK